MNEFQKTPAVTVILTNYARAHNIVKIVDALREQTLLPILQMVDNSPLPHPIAPLLDRVALFPFGSGSYGRMLLSFYADTEWIALLADDVIPADKDFLKDALDIAKKRPEVITGCAGRSFSLTPPHYGGQQQGEVPIVAGHFVIFRKKLLEKVRHYWEPVHKTRELWMRCDDIYLSLEIGKGKPIHWADAGLFNRLKSLPVGGTALSKEEGHSKARETIAAAFANLFSNDLSKSC